VTLAVAVTSLPFLVSFILYFLQGSTSESWQLAVAVTAAVALVVSGIMRALA